MNIKDNTTRTGTESASSNKQALAYDATQNQIKIADAKAEAVVSKILGSKEAAYEDVLREKWMNSMPSVPRIVKTPEPAPATFPPPTLINSLNDCGNPHNDGISVAQNMVVVGCNGYDVLARNTDGTEWEYSNDYDAWMKKTE